MPSLIKRIGKRRWRASIMVQGNVRQKVFPDDSKDSYRAAVLWEAQAKETLKNPNQKTDTASWMVMNWLNDYLDFAESRLTKKTYMEKKGTFNRLLSHIRGETFLEDITVTSALKFLQQDFKARSGYATNKDRKNLNTAWSWGRRYLQGFPSGQNPFHVVERFPEKRSPRYIPPEDDFWKVYNMTTGQDKLLLLTFLHLAARRGEIFNLQWSDISFHDSRIRLWTNKRLGGDKEADWLPMTTELKSALLKWWEERPVKSEHVFVCLDRYSFCEECFGKPFQYRIHFMRRLCVKAGVKRFGFHAIRHLAASILYKSGYPVAVIQAVLRHKSAQTTAKYLQTLGVEQTRLALEEVMANRGPAKVLEFSPQKRTPQVASSGG